MDRHKHSDTDQNEENEKEIDHESLKIEGDDESNIIHFEKNFPKLVKLESEPTKYADDVENLIEIEGEDYKEIEELNQKYSFSFDKCPQAFTLQRKFIEDSKARLKENKTAILDAIEALKVEKPKLKGQSDEIKNDEDIVNDEYKSVKNYSDILSKREEIEQDISLYSNSVLKLYHDKTKMKQQIKENQIGETINLQFIDKFSQILDQKDELAINLKANQSAIKNLKSLLSNLKKAKEYDINYFKDFKSQMKELSDTIQSSFDENRSTIQSEYDEIFRCIEYIYGFIETVKGANKDYTTEIKSTKNLFNEIQKIVQEMINSDTGDSEDLTAKLESALQNLEKFRLSYRKAALNIEKLYEINRNYEYKQEELKANDDNLNKVKAKIDNNSKAIEKKLEKLQNCKINEQSQSQTNEAGLVKTKCSQNNNKQIQTKDDSSNSNDEEQKTKSRSTKINLKEENTQKKLMELKIIENCKSIAESLFYLKNKYSMNKIQDTDTKVVELLQPIIDQYYRIDWFRHNIQCQKEENTSKELALSEEMLKVIDDIYKYGNKLNLYMSNRKSKTTKIKILEQLNEVLSKCCSDYYNFQQKSIEPQEKNSDKECDQDSDSISLKEEIKSLKAINAVLNDQLEALINNEDRLNIELSKENESIVNSKSESFDNTQEIFTFVDEYCKNEECKEKVLEELTKMEKFESFDMQAIDKCFDQISINIIKNHYNNDADNNGGRNQFTESQLNDLNKIVEICTSKAKKLDTLLKKNKMHDSLNEIESELNKLIKSRDKTFDEFKTSQDIFKSMTQTYKNKTDKFNLDYFKDEDNLDKIDNQIEESLNFINSASLSTDKLMDDISNSKKETEQNISTMKKNIKDAENIINHIDKNIDNLNKGIEDSSSSLLPKKVKLQKEICNSITVINAEIKKFNQAKQKYDKFKQGFVDKKVKINKAIITFNEKKKLLEEINQSYPYIEEQLERMEKQLEKELEEDAGFYISKAQYKKCSIIVRKNNLTLERTDAIVNPANEELKHFGGAAKAIADKGGKVIWKESKSYLKEHGKLYTGTVNRGKRLDIKQIIK